MQLTASEILTQGLSLPPVERELIAHRLWQSLPEAEVQQSSIAEILAEVKQRDAEMSSGSDPGREHAEVMAAARKAI